MNVLGLSAFFHESACCLLVDGRLAAAAEEERFSRLKHDPRLPVEAFRFCLRQAGLRITDLDAVAFYERPDLKLERQRWAGPPRGAPPEFAWPEPEATELAIREGLGWDGPLVFCEHHRSHAASAFFYSPFEEAAILTVDGVGEWATTAYGRAAGRTIEILEEVRFPHSLGLLYSTLTSYLGFAVNDGEYKVMGLAPYGRPRFLPEMRKLVTNGEGGQFRLDLAYFDFVRGPRMFSDALPALFGQPARRPESAISRFHQDVAASLQRTLEEILLDKVRFLHRRAPSENLCLAGGVALNCVANGRIRREGPFARLFVPPAAGDSGGALGAAALTHAELTGERPRLSPLRHALHGPGWRSGEVKTLLEACGLAALDFRGREPDLIEEVAGRLAERQIVGWFQGRAEIGPRALGARSILANPRDPEIRERLNRKVKKRESFRPFAPALLVERSAEVLDLDEPSPFMLLTCQVKSGLDLPGVTHVDGSARPQTVDARDQPRFAALLAAFEHRTGCPALVNTSFNVRGEPIVSSPVDALFCFAEAGLDALVIEDFVIDRAALPACWRDLLPWWRRGPERAFGGPRSAVSDRLYTFA